MKFTLQTLIVFVTILAVMAATLRMTSPHSVLIMLACVCGLLIWAAIGSFLAVGLTRRVLAAAAIGGFVYLVLYVTTDTAVEAWINAIAIAPFASMKGGPASSVPAADLRELSTTMEYQYFQQKVHLVLALILACVMGWIASS